MVSRVRNLIWTNKKRTFHRLSRRHFPFFKVSIQCKKEPWIYVFFSSSTPWVINNIHAEALSVFAPFSLEFYLNYKVRIKIQGLSTADCNFQDLEFLF